MHALRPSHPSQEQRVPRHSQLSPVCPHVWMKPVDSLVDSRWKGVRSAPFVRLSPCVDPLWIPTTRRHVHDRGACAQNQITCGGSQRLPRLSPSPHSRTLSRPQPLPSREVPPTSQKGAPSTLSPRPMTTTTDIDPLFTHRLRTAGGGYLPYCLSPTGQRAWRTPSGGRP